jgi:AAA domain
MDLKCLFHIKAKPRGWVWKGVIPAGQLSLLIGERSVGKSLLALDLAARVTQGLSGPHTDETGQRGAVILFIGQDDLEGTVRVRLDAAGADEKWVHCVQSEDLGKEDAEEFCAPRWAFREDCDVYTLRTYLDGLRKIGQPVRLIVIDPASVFLDIPEGQRDIKLRGMIAKLGDLATSSGAAILLLAQPSNSGIGKRNSWLPIPRALADAARSVWMIVRDVDEPERRLLLPVNTHLCETPDGFGFTIRNNRLDWEHEPVSLTAEQFHSMTTEPKSSALDEEELSELSRAAEWLKLRLNDGYVLSTIVREEARANKITVRTLRQAYQLLGCRRGKETIADGRWFWRLPGRAAIAVPSNSIEVDRTVTNLIELEQDENCGQNL